MVRMWRVLAVVTIITASVPVCGFAECLLGGAGQRATNVYFSNGILSRTEHAYNNMVGLTNAYDVALAQETDSRYEFGYIYNATTGNVVTEVVSALVQKSQGDGRVFGYDNIAKWARALVGEIARGASGDAIREWMQRVTNVPLTEEHLNVALNVVVGSLVESLRELEQADVAKHVECYAENLKEGKRVIVVAHSRGNLFANSAITAVEETLPWAGDSIGTVGIATPAGSAVNSWSAHVTAKDDVVINALRWVPGVKVLRWNVENDAGFLPGLFDGRDLWNHTFARSYFEPALKSRGMIDDLVEELARDLRYPSPPP